MIKKKTGKNKETGNGNDRRDKEKKHIALRSDVQFVPINLSMHR